MTISLLAICVSEVKPLLFRDPHDDKQVHREMSGIQKLPISTITQPMPVLCKTLGLEGDEQADLSVHGGPLKAVYCYPAEHYEFWKRELPWLNASPSLFGQVGENLCLDGILESDIWIGDQLHIGKEVVLQVVKPREPCFKFNARMRSNQASKLMTKNERCGWYCRVLKEGQITPGDPITLIAGSRDTTVREDARRLLKRS